MTYRVTFAGFLGGMFLLAACSSTPESTSDAETTETVTTESSTMEADAEATAPADIVMFTAMTSHMQTQLSRLATEKATTPAVRELGEDMADQSSEVLTRIQELVDAVNMEMPHTLTVDQQAIYDSLQELSPEAFEQAYVQTIYEDLEKNKENLEGLAAQSDSEIVRGLTEAIIELQEPQLERIEEVQQEMM